MSFSATFLEKCHKLVDSIDSLSIEKCVSLLVQLRSRNGRLFIIGSGGGAGHASHATCDFRKLCGIEAYAPYDNVSELTARTNDEGWETTLSNWLNVSKFNKLDGLLVFSVGGGNIEKEISMNLVNAIQLAKKVGATVIGIVGKDGGYTSANADAAVLIPDVDSKLVTPLAEGFQAVLWHLIVSHPNLQVCQAKWESVSATK